MGNIKSLDMDENTLVYAINGTEFTVSYADMWAAGIEKWDLLAELERPFTEKYGATEAQYDGTYLTLKCGDGAVVAEVGPDYNDPTRDNTRSFVKVARVELAA